MKNKAIKESHLREYLTAQILSKSLIIDQLEAEIKLLNERLDKLKPAKVVGRNCGS